MFELNLNTTSWWLIAALCAGVNLAILVPAMPTRATKIRVSSMPVIIAALGYITSIAKPDYSPRLILEMCAIGLLAIAVCLLGFRKKMTRMVLDYPEGGDVRPEHYGLAQEAMIRFTVAAVAMGGLLYLFKP
ncbi:hypothetical protein ACFVXG_08680 [Kitasatospora sp. NPDC058162]|uniref:hypothetical protein n=1 Tax=Kitasatospora sp. NPDC058162 TaxID=3346362 RepID=UPI0036DDAD2D